MQDWETGTAGQVCSVPRLCVATVNRTMSNCPHLFASLVQESQLSWSHGPSLCWMPPQAQPGQREEALWASVVGR